MAIRADTFGQILENVTYQKMVSTTFSRFVRKTWVGLGQTKDIRARAFWRLGRMADRQHDF